MITPWQFHQEKFIKGQPRHFRNGGSSGGCGALEPQEYTSKSQTVEFLLLFLRELVGWLQTEV